jgi:hypothetical protein
VVTPERIAAISIKTMRKTMPDSQAEGKALLMNRPCGRQIDGHRCLVGCFWKNRAERTPISDP